MSDAQTIDVCLCTFRRPSVALTLQSIARQKLGPGLRMRVIVADNDETDSARKRVEGEARALGLELIYRHAPARNISIARNACLEAADNPLCAFIDDDEIAPPHWLQALFDARSALQADVVFGPVKALYGPEAPRWMARADLHSFGPVVLAGGEVRTGYTSNCLMRREAIGQARFDPDLGQSGGEDTDFFYRLFKAGLRLGEAQAAVLEEPVAPHRARLAWLLERSFRSGQTHARLLRQDGSGRLSASLTAAVKALACAGLVLANLPRPGRAAAQLIRGALHVGVVASLLGAHDLKIYGRANP